MVHHSTTLSEALKNIRGDFLFWQRQVYEHLNKPTKKRARARHPRCGRLSGRSPRRGEKDLGPGGLPIPSRRARAAKGSPPTPPRPHGQTTGLSRIPKGWRTAGIITFTTNALDHAVDPTTARSGRMGGCQRSMCHRHAQPPQVTGGHSGCHGPRGCLVCEGITGHQCESAHSGGEPIPPNHSGRQTELGGGGLSRVPPAPEAPPRRKGVDPARALQKGGSTLFPHPPRQWEEPPERPRGGDPPSKGRSKGGQNRQGKQQAQHQTTSGSDKGHTETP